MRNIEVQYFDPELSEENKAYMDHLTRDQLVLWSQRLRIAVETMRQEGKGEDYCVLVRAKLMREYALKRLEGLDILAALPFGRIYE